MRVIVLAAVWLMMTSAEEREFSNTWVAEVHGGEEVAQRVARNHGYVYQGPVHPFDDHYIFSREDHPEVSKRNSAHLTSKLTDLDEVKWAEQQVIVKRSKRGVIPDFSPPHLQDFLEDRRLARGHVPRHHVTAKWNSLVSRGAGNADIFDAFLDGISRNRKFSSGLVHEGYGYTSLKIPLHPDSSLENSRDMAAENEAGEEQRDISRLGQFSTMPATKDTIDLYEGSTKHIGCVSSKKSAYESMFNDPLWSKQWYSQDYRTSNMPVMDHNVVPVYKMGITGRNVTVAVVDDGVEHDHPDLEGNFAADLSYDMCHDKPGSQPDPAYMGHANSHGTKCAGEIAMVANNGKCGVGIAYNCRVAGIKTLGNRAYDLVEAKGLIHKIDTFDIYSSSWGPSDDGQTMEKVGRMASNSIERGVTQGRQGKGAIYTFAAGNGRHANDNCAADGYINHPYTIAIASVSQHGKTVYYSERCAAIFAGTYSGGNKYDEKVATIDLNGQCATNFSGTSAATPIATGIIALTLEANPNLTYRDVMHLITMTAEVAPVANNENIWYKNGRGFWVSNDFGFGLLNAENMVRTAMTWATVPAKSICTVDIPLRSRPKFTVGETARVRFNTQACAGTQHAVKFLEQVILTSTVSYPYRGAISIHLTSPAGTRSHILEPRKSDDDRSGLKQWSIKSLHTWGEDPAGTWEVSVTAHAIDRMSASTGHVDGLIISFHGTAEGPAHYSNSPVRKYSSFRLPDNSTSELLQQFLATFVEIIRRIYKN